MTLLGDIPEICGAYVLMKKNKNKTQQRNLLFVYGTSESDQCSSQFTLLVTRDL